ncbi:MAG: TolC family protein [Bryobacteraceae bacterium]
MKKTMLLLVWWLLPGRAQDPMSLKDAVRLALEKNQSVAASTASEKAAGSRIAEARGGSLPKVNYSESWGRSDNPVFVFSSLLTQHQFGEQNFQVGPLNRPDFLNNFQSQLTADQTLYDAGQTKRAVHSAELTKDLAREDGRRTRMEVIASVIRCYYDALLGAEQLDANSQAMRSAEADLERAQTVRSAGMSTDVDALSIRVHLAGVREQQIRRTADLEVARAALNDALGLGLDTAHTLTTGLTSLELPEGLLADYERNAVSERPEARQVKLATSLAENQAATARSSLLPQVGVHAAFEADRQRFYDRGGANWLVSIGLRWNLFNGFSDKARIEESRFALSRSEAEQERAGSAIRLQVRRAYADLGAADQRIEVAKASVAEAEESLRITQNRYEAGMSNVTDLLRTETAVLDARTRHLAAIHDQRVAAAMLELAAGTLSADSEVLN